MPILQSTFDAVQRLLLSWWNVDRIRIAANSGRLLQLAPGDRLLVRQTVMTIETRSILTRAGESPGEITGVVYKLVQCDDENYVEHRLLDRDDDDTEDDDGMTQDESVDCRLVVMLRTENQRHVHRFCRDQRVTELLDDELVVLSGQS